MAMPGAIELYKHYGTESEFEADREALLTEGWALEGFHATRGSGWRSWFGRGGDGIDAHYLRAEWPAE
jgi:hypothetical protein